MGKKWFFAKGQSGYVKEESEDGKFVFVKGQTGYFDNDGDDGGGQEEDFKLYRFMIRGGGDNNTGGPIWVSPADDPERHLSPQDIIDMGYKPGNMFGITEIVSGSDGWHYSTESLPIRQFNGAYVLIYPTLQASSISEPFSGTGRGIYSDEILEPFAPVIQLSGRQYVHPYTTEPVNEETETGMKQLTPNDLIEMGVKKSVPIILFRTYGGGSNFEQDSYQGLYLRNDKTSRLDIHNLTIYEAESMDAPYHKSE